MNPFDDKSKATEAAFRCCIPGCAVTGPKTGTSPPLSQLGDGQEAHVLCYPHLADWWVSQGSQLRRPPTRSEWKAFLALSTPTEAQSPERRNTP